MTDENLVLPIGSGWDNRGGTRDGRTLIAYHPAGETEQSSQEQLFVGLDVPPAPGRVALADLVDQTVRACAVAAEPRRVSRTRGSYTYAGTYFDCDRMTETGAALAFVSVSIKGKDADYTALYMRRAVPGDARSLAELHRRAATDFPAFFNRLLLCDTRSRQDPCPDDQPGPYIQGTGR